MSDCDLIEGPSRTNGNPESTTELCSSSSHAALMNENDKNSKSIVCQFCDSKVLTPDMASLRRLNGHFLPAMRQKKSIATGNNDSGLEGETLDDFWLVEDMFHFENVGFSKAVDNVKYLICADCEMGPIGFHDPSAPKEFYVALARVMHK